MMRDWDLHIIKMTSLGIWFFFVVLDIKRYEEIQKLL